MEETTELKELINIVWQGKVAICVCIIVCMLFAGIVSWFVLDEKYESKAVVQVVSGVQDTGILSNYIAAEFTPDIYAQRIKNQSVMQQALLDAGIQTAHNSKNIVVAVDPDPTKRIVELTFTSDSAKQAQQQLQIFMDATKQKMNESVQAILQDLEETYKYKSTILTKEIEELIEQYNQKIRENNLPELLILQTILSSDIILNISEEQTVALSKVNGSLQNQLLQLQAQIQSKSDEYRAALADYQSVKTGLDSFKPDPFVRVIMEPNLVESPTAPNKVLNLAIAMVLGIMLGLGGTFFNHYWRSSTTTK